MSQAHNKISGVVITLNEERNIERCLNSMSKVADELVVVDSYSTDNTCELAEKLGARVIKQKFLGHIEQKNFAKDQARYNRVLSLDADEALSDELTASILEAKPQLHKYAACKMNRMTNYCGKWIKHSGWYPDTKVRLFQKTAGAWGGKNPHDRFIPPEGKVKYLRGDILHYSFYSIEEHRKQIESFSSISAQSYFEAGKRSNLFKIIFSPVAKFVRNYILKAGFLDGKEGWSICRLSAYATYLKYKKLLNIQRQNKKTHDG